VYYFAYGSNMNWRQMKQRCSSATFVSVACLKDHRFAITRQSRRRLCGTADIVPEPGSEVFGIVYEIDDYDLGLLDGFEDGYGREKMFVTPIGDGRNLLEAWVYIAEKESCPPLPNALYKRLIVEGARHWKLPQDYIDMLEKLETAIE
jgi:gamma-glutamylcyclotransferase